MRTENKLRRHSSADFSAAHYVTASAKLMTASEAADFLNVTEGWIKERLRARCPESERLPVIRMSRKVQRFRRADLEAYVERCLVNRGETQMKIVKK